jgi:hypothetical protein
MKWNMKLARRYSSLLWKRKHGDDFFKNVMRQMIVSEIGGKAEWALLTI